MRSVVAESDVTLAIGSEPNELLIAAAAGELATINRLMSQAMRRRGADPEIGRMLPLLLGSA